MLGNAHNTSRFFYCTESKPGLEIGNGSQEDMDITKPVGIFNVCNLFVFYIVF